MYLLAIHYVYIPCHAYIKFIHNLQQSNAHVASRSGNFLQDMISESFKAF